MCHNQIDWDDADWTDWQEIHEPSGHRAPAVYMVRLVRATGRVFALNRLLERDANGILCIGNSANMERRLRRFIAGMDTGEGHAPANRLYRLRQCTAFDQVFPKARYEYRFLRAEDKAQAEQFEIALLRRYFRCYGELPPLNSAMPGRHVPWEE